MTKINNNNLEALKIFYGAKQTKKAEAEEQKERIEENVKEFEPKKVQASALDAVAAQIWGAQLSKVDVSDAAVEKRMAELFANSPFMKALDELNDTHEEIDFVGYAQKNIQGVNHDKLAKYLAKGLSFETQKDLANVADKITL